MYSFPVKYFEENLIISKGTKSCWAVYRVLGFNYDLLSAGRKILRLNAITRFIANIGAEAKILIVPVAQDIKEHYENLISRLPEGDPLSRYARAHAEGAEAFLSEKLRQGGVGNDFSVYLIVKLNAPRAAGEILDALIKRPMKTIGGFFEVEYKELLLSELKAFKAASDVYFNEQDKRLRLERASAETIQWLIRRMFRRGIAGQTALRKGKNGELWTPYGESVLKDGQRAVRPHEKDILSLTESLIEPRHRHVKITGSDGKASYQTFLAMAHIPDGLAFPGSEWLLLLQDYPVAAEACLHITTTEYRESMQKIAGKKREIQSQMEHVAGSDEIPEELFEAKENADSLESELRQGRLPLARVSCSICLAAESEEEMNAQANFIKERYEDANFVIERPLADQFKMFMEFIPGSGRFMTDYLIPLPPKTVAGSMFPATRLLGDNEGPFIGVTGVLEKMVFLEMARACRMNRSASAAFLGTLGGGKSFNANLLVYLNILYGGRALVIDPKGERGAWAESLPELAGEISVTTLSAGKEDQGKLDPFLIYKDDPDEAGELATNILCEIFGYNTKDQEYTAILEAVKRVKEGGAPCMKKLQAALSSFDPDDDLRPVAGNIARRVRLLSEAGMARLLFGSGEEEGLSLDKRLNILQIQNLQMPDPSTPKQDYTLEETVSTVLMLPIASFAKKFAMTGRSVFKLVLLDESWALNSTQMGIKLFNFLARMGRSLNAGAIFIGHSVSDLKGDGIKAAITYKFCFKATVRDEAIRVLDFLGLEETDGNLQIVSGLGNGECLFQDLDGRVGLLRFDPIYEHIMSAFNTNPNARREEEEDDEGGEGDEGGEAAQ